MGVDLYAARRVDRISGGVFGAEGMAGELVMIAHESENNEPEDNEGAMGGTLDNGLTPRREAMIERQALREGWPVPNMATKIQLVEKQVKIALKGENREATTAFRALLAADALNAEIEPCDDDPTTEIEDADFRVSDVLSGIMLAAPALVAGDGGNGKQVDTPRANGKANGVSKP